MAAAVPREVPLILTHETGRKTIWSSIPHEGLRSIRDVVEFAAINLAGSHHVRVVTGDVYVLCMPNGGQQVWNRFLRLQRIAERVLLSDLDLMKLPYHQRRMDHPLDHTETLIDPFLGDAVMGFFVVMKGDWPILHG